MVLCEPAWFDASSFTRDASTFEIFSLWRAQRWLAVAEADVGRKVRDLILGQGSVLGFRLVVV